MITLGALQFLIELVRRSAPLEESYCHKGTFTEELEGLLFVRVEPLEPRGWKMTVTKAGRDAVERAQFAAMDKYILSGGVLSERAGGGP